MRAEHEIRLHAFREKQRASQMGCIERIEGRPHWLARPAQDKRSQANLANGSFRRLGRLVGVGQPLVIKCALQAKTVGCT